MFALQFVHRDKLIENAIVYHQAHCGIARVVLQTEKALRGVVSLHVVHPGTFDELLVLFPIGGEGHPAVEEDFQVGPYLL